MKNKDILEVAGIFLCVKDNGEFYELSDEHIRILFETLGRDNVRLTDTEKILILAGLTTNVDLTTVNESLSDHSTKNIDE